MRALQFPCEDVLRIGSGELVLGLRCEGSLCKFPRREAFEESSLPWLSNSDAMEGFRSKAWAHCFRLRKVVPWSSTPPPPVTSSSSSEDSSSRFSGGGGGVSASAVTLSLKRLRQNADLGPEDDLGCSSSQPNYNATLAALSARESGDDEATSSGSFRPLKEQRRTLEARSTQVSAQDIAESTSAALIGSLKRFQQDIISGNDASATILGICKLSKDPRAVDLVSTDSLNPPI
ncbi:hypothetical protein HHK36_002022 [Tetracentron sinense]|uniref:Uncharacterized protein n=1 Tax=Tetracentron sinense TaxID=13715 RepID=A0A834ZZ36_TETSI|nr:hypothetical protein HHK36_002022 [Tetracentron sinense]